MKKYLPYLFTAAVVIVVGIASLFHRPFGSFDETNTIRIVSEPVWAVLQILKEEPNFPLFYLLLKCIWEAVSRNILLLQSVYFLFYLAGGYFFYKIFTFFSKNTSHALYALGAFLAIPTVVYNASYIRMYNPALAIGLCAIYFILQFSVNKKQRYLYIGTILLLLLMLMHPIGITMGLLVFALVISKELTPKNRVIIVLMSLAGILGWVGQLLTKTDLMRIYFSVGPKYIGELHNTFSDSGFLFHYLSLFLDQRREYIYVGFPLAVTLIFESAFVYWNLIKSKTFSLIDNLATSSFILFFVVSIVFGSKIYLHHLHYLIPFGVFSLVYVYLKHWEIARNTFNQWWKVLILVVVIAVSVVLSYLRGVSTANVYSEMFSLLLGILLMLVFVYLPQLRIKLVLLVHSLLFAVTIMYVVFLTMYTYQKRCEYIQSESTIEGTVFLMQHNSANLYFNCLDSYDQIILLDEERPLFHTKGRSDIEVLTEQAIRGGSLGSVSELQQVFDEDRTLLEYNIQRLSIRPEPKVLCRQKAPQFRTFAIKGYKFVGCGKDSEYIYEKSQ